MRQQSIGYQDSQETLEAIKGELLEVLLGQEDFPYPWNQTAEESQNYWTELEDNFSLLDCFDTDELALNAQDFFSNLEQHWNNCRKFQVKESLFTRFGEWMPSQWLDAIAQQAQEIIYLNLSPVEQLIACVKPILSQWTEDDLHIFARPLVYAMRGTTEPKQAPWEQLSELDRARLTMMVAHEALTQLQQENL